MEETTIVIGIVLCIIFSGFLVASGVGAYFWYTSMGKKVTVQKTPSNLTPAAPPSGSEQIASQQKIPSDLPKVTSPSPAKVVETRAPIPMASNFTNQGPSVPLPVVSSGASVTPSDLPKLDSQSPAKVVETRAPIPMASNFTNQGPSVPLDGLSSSSTQPIIPIIKHTYARYMTPRFNGCLDTEESAGGMFCYDKCIEGYNGMGMICIQI
jgi:hypothetical protein